VLSATFNNISVISWRSVSFVACSWEEIVIKTNSLFCPV
jgi:hypothetical protein